MRTCPNCRQPVEDDQTFCPSCMSPITHIPNIVAVCRFCGKPLDPETRCCTGCGRSGDVIEDGADRWKTGPLFTGPEAVNEAAPAPAAPAQPVKKTSRAVPAPPAKKPLRPVPTPPAKEPRKAAPRQENEVTYVDPSAKPEKKRTVKKWLPILLSVAGGTALAVALRYLYTTQKNDLENITQVRLFHAEKTVSLSATTRANLELTESFRRREKKGSLLWVLDRTRTAMGKRKLRAFVEQPLRSVSEITYRQNGVEELYADPILRGDLIHALSGVQDFERIATRIVYGSANAKELRGLFVALQAVPALKSLLSGVKSNILKKIRDEMDENAELSALIDRAIVEEPPFSLREGGFIRPGYSEELDSLREIVSGGREFLLKIEREEQEKTGIKKLRIGYNKVFGYYIEILNTYKDLVPDYYIRKQTLTNCERYITPELKELEAKVLTARERIEKLEYDLFCEVRSTAAGRQQSLRQTGDLIATLDTLCSLADVAAENDYVRPVVDLSGVVDIKDGRHPVVEKFIGDSPFVPNDTYLDRDKSRTLIITGPNMAGKSTYMRQTALIVLLAQIGSFVPAREATIGVVDAIYTRIGASDDLAAGQSTFMTEMSEVAAILENATDESLVILDEIGRGTSTYDGMAIARAVLEYINSRSHIGCKTLFATHYHELTEMEMPDSGYKNLNCAVKKRGDDISFLRKITDGPADGSYGIQVAKIAGVPDKVVRRAKAILKELEQKELQRQISAADTELDLDLLAALTGENRTNPILRELSNLNINELTPFEALSKLYDLQKMLDTV